MICDITNNDAIIVNFLCINLSLKLCMCGCIYVSIHMCHRVCRGSQGINWKSRLSFNSVLLQDRSLIIRQGTKHIYSLSHLGSPRWQSFNSFCKHNSWERIGEVESRRGKSKMCHWNCLITVVKKLPTFYWMKMQWKKAEFGDLNHRLWQIFVNDEMLQTKRKFDKSPVSSHILKRLLAIKGSEKNEKCKSKLKHWFQAIATRWGPEIPK